METWKTEYILGRVVPLFEPRAQKRRWKFSRRVWITDQNPRFPTPDAQASPAVGRSQSPPGTQIDGHIEGFRAARFDTVI
jgi:hypothetical protein